jgi:hypothetical protein
VIGEKKLFANLGAVKKQADAKRILAIQAALAKRNGTVIPQLKANRLRAAFANGTVLAPSKNITAFLANSTKLFGAKRNGTLLLAPKRNGTFVLPARNGTLWAANRNSTKLFGAKRNGTLLLTPQGNGTLILTASNGTLLAAAGNSTLTFSPIKGGKAGIKGLPVILPIGNRTLSSIKGNMTDAEMAKKRAEILAKFAAFKRGQAAKANATVAAVKH